MVIDMHRAGYALYAALDATQKAAADAGEVPDELLTGPGMAGFRGQQMQGTGMPGWKSG